VIPEELALGCNGSARRLTKVRFGVGAARKTDDVDLAPIHLEHYGIYRYKAVSGRWGWKWAIAAKICGFMEARQDVNVERAVGPVAKNFCTYACRN
jgi:hypothetical protein